MGEYDHSVDNRDVPFPCLGGQPQSHLGETPTKQMKEHCDVSERIGK